MKFNCTMKEPTLDMHGNVTAIFAVNKEFLKAYEELKGCDKLTLEIKQYKAKRSLDANSYLWVLLEKLSCKLSIPRWELYLESLRKYGSFEYIPLREKDIYLAQSVHRIVVDRGAQKVTDLHGREEELHVLQCWKGSSKYNSQEMSRLIKGVLEDCRAEGIPEADLITPDEKEELKQKWGIDVG